MGKLFPVCILKNAELLLRLTMIVATITAGVSKFFSHGGFRDYYLQQFNRPELRNTIAIFFARFLPDHNSFYRGRFRTYAVYSQDAANFRCCFRSVFFDAVRWPLYHGRVPGSGCGIAIDLNWYFGLYPAFLYFLF